MVARGLFARFVGSLMLLIHHNEAQIGERAKDRRACPNHNLRITSSDPIPFIIALASTESMMENGNFVLKATAKALHSLRRKRNLRHQHDGALSSLNHLFNSL